MHKVICLYCNKTFDADKEPFVQTGRRYSHEECYRKAQQKVYKTSDKKENIISLPPKNTDKEKLENYIIELFGSPYINPKIIKQINEYINDYHFTYNGIFRALKYFYQVKGNSIEKAQGGIGIVPYVYQDAYNYFYSLWEINEKNKSKEVEKYKPQEIEVHIKSPQRTINKKKFFTFLNLEEAEDEQ